MSYRRFVEPILDGLPEGTFAAVVTGDAVERGKPYPDPYLKAARLLGVDPGDCLAIEDSNTGARSAESAGCPVLCVPNHVPILEGERRMFADSLAGLTAANLPVLSRLATEIVAGSRPNAVGALRGPRVACGVSCARYRPRRAAGAPNLKGCK